MSPQKQSATGQKAHRRNTSINNTSNTFENLGGDKQLAPIDTTTKKTHVSNILNDNIITPTTPPATPSKNKKDPIKSLSNSKFFDVRSMFFLLMFCGSLVVFLGALTGIGLPFDDDDSELLSINIKNNINVTTPSDDGVQFDNTINELNNNNYNNNNDDDDNNNDDNNNNNNDNNNDDDDDDDNNNDGDDINNNDNNNNNNNDDDDDDDDDADNNNIEIINLQPLNENKENAEIQNNDNNPTNEETNTEEVNNEELKIVEPNKEQQEEKNSIQDPEPLPPQNEMIDEVNKIVEEHDDDMLDGIKPDEINNKITDEIHDEQKIEHDEQNKETIYNDLPNKLENKKNNYTYIRHKTHFTYDDVVESLTEEEREHIIKTRISEMNPDESLDTSCGSWQANYSKLHEKILSKNGVQRYVSYIVDDKNNIGGLSDRILGMTSAFVFALLTNRAFLADWQTPFPLETIFNSPNIDWSHDSSNPSSDILDLETSELNVIDFDAKNLDQQFMLSNWTIKYPSPFIKFYSNRGMIIRSFDSKFYSQSLKDMGLRPHTAFGCVLDYLFKPLPNALSFITQYTSLFALPSIFTVGIQINTKNEQISLEDYNHYFKCADQLTQTYAAPHQKVIYYLVTDSPKLRDETVHKFDHIIVSGLPISSNLNNIDSDPDGVNNAIIESWIFSKTDYRIIPSGDYGKLSAFYSKQLHTTVSIDHQSQDLDCTREDIFTTFIKLASESSLG